MVEWCVTSTKIYLSYYYRWCLEPIIKSELQVVPWVRLYISRWIEFLNQLSESFLKFFLSYPSVIKETNFFMTNKK